MDRRRFNGGSRPGAGRKPKADEQALIEKLRPLEPLAFSALQKALENGERWAVKMFFEYLYGRPTQMVSDHIFREMPLFPDIEIVRHVHPSKID